MLGNLIARYPQKRGTVVSWHERRGGIKPGKQVRIPEEVAFADVTKI
jgi:hypothetical protein